MKNKIQKWYKLKEVSSTWIPCRDEDYFGNINDFEFYYTYKSEQQRKEI